MTTHYLLLKNSVLIHIVVFYKRVPGFYWHGSVIASNLPKDLTKVSELKPWKQEGAFDRYNKCSKILNTFLFLFSNKMMVIRAGISLIGCQNSSLILFV